MTSIVLSNFITLIKDDPNLLGSGQGLFPIGVVVGNGKCSFTLDALHQWVGGVAEIDYPGFRSKLYQSTLNQNLSELGYKVEVASSSGNVDTSRYQLVKL
ncbi:MAG: hypothetical protein ACJAYG_002256 [Oceanicoccus sp.]|jgi:hypothetical protein